MEATSNLVIKVKYGDVLRRFNACVVDDELDINVDGLRKKICSLFSLSPETELVLTYVDEDGDDVTLVDDSELCDVVKQALNPLRITVQLKAEKNGREESENSTLSRSPRVQKNNSECISDSWRPLQPLNFEAPVKFAFNVASKSVTSVPGVTDVLDSKTKEQTNGIPKMSTDGIAAKEQTNGIHKIDNTSSKVLESEEKSVKANEISKVPQSEASMGCSKIKSGDVTSFSKTFGPKIVFTSKTTSAAKPSFSKTSGPKIVFTSKTTSAAEPSFPKTSGPKIVFTSNTTSAAETSFPKTSGPKIVFTSKMTSAAETSFPITSGPKIIFTSKTTSAAEKKEILMARARPSGDKSQTTSSDPCGTTSLSGGNIIPFKQATKKAGTPLSKAKMPSYTPTSPAYHVSPAEGSPIVPPHTAAKDFQFMGSNVVTHHTVQCDYCGAHPITGPRFNSIVKEDFDLCSFCYYYLGNDKDYIKMDNPGMGAYHPLQSSENGLYSPQHYYLPPNIRQAGVFVSAPKISGSKLSSCFIRDVNVVDDTSLAPLTSFTKTWRLKNNGNVVWPKKTQLVWVGGDKLCNGISFELDIPDLGIAVNEELDVSVDFISPERPGRYISYWRMASPSDQMFGQRVWVLIQVDASLKEIENIRNFNLNSLPNNDANGHDVKVDSQRPIAEDSLSRSSDAAVQLVQPLTQPNVEHEKIIPINDSLLVGDGALSSVASPNPNSVPYPNIGFSNVGSVLSSVLVSPPPRPDSVVFPKSPAQEIAKEVEVEEELLRQLQNMGFKKVGLNKEILRLNGYDMVKTVDDLCGAQWEPILKELHEMGFTDKRMNKMLLEKNNGSIKRVVLDLISGGEL